MPTYDYVCETCGHEFEAFQSMKDPKLTDCPQEGCDGSVRRLLGTGAGVIFKGSGFYETDYRSASYKEAAKKDQDSSKPATGGTSTSGDAAKTKDTATPKTDAPKAKPASKEAAA